MIIEYNEYNIQISNQFDLNFDLTKYSKIAIIVDQNTKKKCLPKLINNLKIKYTLIEIKAEEKYKNIQTCNFIWKSLINNEFEKNSLIINLGGGIVNDVGGYCAACYKRGIDFINIPTTLLAMVDASIGGKTGVNLGFFKNQIGIFKNPKFIYVYTGFLKTLTSEEIKSGLGEVIKHLLISDKKYWNFINKNGFENINWEEVILNSISIKQKIVQSDPFEKNIRKALNFGHTYGHSIESYYLEKNQPIKHGEAVLMGILLEIELCDISEKEKKEINNFITSNFILPKIPKKIDLKKYLINDKKNRSQQINFSLISAIGKYSIDNLFKLHEL